jgi:nicotinamidase-related amidase
MNDFVASRRRFLATSGAGCLWGASIPAVLRAADAAANRVIQLPVRWQQRLGDSERFEPKTAVRALPAGQTAILICDMWNEHWCASASRRCGKLAEKMAPLVDEARTAGVRIVHAPSNTLDSYQDHPARKRALAVATVTPRVPIESWCSLEEAREGSLPIDDSDGGCDCEAPCKQGSPWTKQHAAITIADEDFLSDDGNQVYAYFVEKGIKNVIYVGVHTNMCVLGRSFGIRQMTRLGLGAILVRDLTDTMYNPRMAPFVPHAQGTDLVIRHVERHWCPTTDSAAVAEGLRG